MTQNAVMIDKPLPNSLETERLVLAAVFLDERFFIEIGALNVSAFYAVQSRQVFVAMQNLAARNELMNPFTVRNELKKIYPTSPLTISELTDWAHGLPHFSDLALYISLLKDKELKRSIIRKCDRLASIAANEDELGTEIAGMAVTEFQDAYTESLDTQKPTVQLAVALESNYARWDRMLKKEIVTIETGLPDVDERLTGGGMEKGMFHVIGARPGKGKTSLGLDMASHNIFQGKVVVFFTMELSRDVLLDRFIAPLAGIERYKITSKWMNEYDYKKLLAVSDSIKTQPLYINHKARTVKDMRLALREVARETGGQIDLIITDFLTKMRSDKASKYEAVSENANALAEFAVEFNAASVVLAQLSRAVAKRTTPEPSELGRVETTDFRDSGEIEELARTILALWGSDESYPRRPVNVSCIKQGEGMLFDVHAVFDTDFMTFGARRALTPR